jgi:hypothetical protein
MIYRKIIADLLFLEAWLLLHMCRISILILPFKVIASKAGQLNLETPNEKIINPWIYEVELAIQRAKRFCIHRSNCFDQALTGAIMLRLMKLPYTLYLGLDKDSNGLKAHAWLRCGSRLITGKDVVVQYTVVASFSFQTNALAS